MSLRIRLALLSLGLASVPLFATEIVWPTTLDLSTVRSAQDYLQPTVSGRLESATFGMVREEGHRFHEGVDIRPGRRDAAGERSMFLFVNRRLRPAVATRAVRP